MEVLWHLCLDRFVGQTENGNKFSHAVRAVVEGEQSIVVFDARLVASNDDGLSQSFSQHV